MKNIVLIVLGISLFLSFSFAHTKVLYVNSYHAQYNSAIVQTKAVKDILEPKGIKLRFVHMNTKRIKSDELRKEEALKVKKVIEDWNPNLVIASDDAASKYVVKEYYKDAKLPFIFIGVNWSVEQYGYPYSNVTGQVEVELAKELIEELKLHAKGKKIGFLSGDTSTDKKALKHYKNVLGIEFDSVKLVKNFDDWIRAYKTMQEDVDMLFFRSNSGIKDWDSKVAKSLIQKKTKVPSGSVNSNMSSYVVVNFAKDNYEFGEYGAKTALKILNGTQVSTIPLTKNKKAKVTLNIKVNS